MSAADIAILAAIVVLLVLCVRHLRHSGGGCAGCGSASGCSAHATGGPCPAASDMLRRATSALGDVPRGDGHRQASGR